jgi:hypothetical protein
MLFFELLCRQAPVRTHDNAPSSFPGRGRLVPAPGVRFMESPDPQRDWARIGTMNHWE